MPFLGVGDTPLLLSMLEELPIGIWVATAPACEVVYSNRCFAKIIGREATDLIPAWPERLEDRQGRRFPLQRLPFCQALERRETVAVDDLVIVRDDGARVFVEALGKPLRNAAGEVEHVVVALRDVTAEVESEAAAVVARHKLRTALEHAPIVLFASDPEGVVTVSEGAALKAMGFKSGELVGRSMLDLYKDHPRVLENHRRALAGEAFRSVVDVGDVVLETWLSPMRGPKGEIGGVIGVSTDITERRRMERQIDRAERLAAVGRLAASVAHEINNPLSYSMEALRLVEDALASEGGDDALASAGGGGELRLRQLVREAAEGMERVHRITRDLKAFSRSDEDARSRQDVRQALATATKMVATRVGARARVDLQPGPPAFVDADPTRLVQIFVNLVLNASDALPLDRAAQNRIAIEARALAPFVVVEIADNGPGVPAELRDRVFDPFFTTKPVGEGTGLGLFVTRNLVEALGGSIVLDDAPGGGARFTIRLPLAAGAPDVAAARVLPAARDEGAARGRVLIIDDEPQLAKIFETRLAPEFDVRVFTRGRAAIDHLLGSGPYDLILCDLMMADLSGMQVYETIKAARPGLEGRVVFMTGGVFDPTVADFLASVPNDCVDKPFDVRAEVRRRLPPR